MRILSIETSCDETAVSIVEAEGGLKSPTFTVLGNALYSQIDVHKEFGGVYPMLAKREHAKNLPPILQKALTEATLYIVSKTDYKEEIWKEIEKILSREGNLYKDFRNTFENIKKPDIDIIGVTNGPGLAPALWVGITFAEALGKLWNIPVVPINHMEGHITSVLAQNTDDRKIIFPALALLISGGHTEIVKIKNWGEYKVIGQTLDDAVGEAFDKTARMLGLQYPGGPEISKLDNYAKEKNLPAKVKLPRPMIHSGNLNFSFSGLKTAVLYYIRDNFNGDGNSMTKEEKADLSREFQNAVIEVLTTKIKEAISETNTKTLIIAGGVIASVSIREAFMEFEKIYPELEVKVPTNSLSTDNSVMIACATYINVTLYPDLILSQKIIKAEGNLKLGI